jgi:hypothetical protein
MRIRDAFLLFGLLGGYHWAAAQQDGYRVAGTVLMSQGRSTAIIVRAPGDTITVKVGDALDDGRVVAIDERYVRVTFPGRDLLLPLSGGPAEVVSTTSTIAAQPIVNEAIDPAREALYSRHLPKKQLLFAIDELSVRLEREGSADDDPENSGPALTRLLEGPIGFPDGAVIRDINGQSFSSVAEGLDIVESVLELEHSEPLRFGLAGASGPRPLYVFPQ